MSLLPNLKLFILGQLNDKRPRPLKVILYSKNAAFGFIADFNKGIKLCKSGEPPSLIFIYRNRTPLGRNVVRQYTQNSINKRKIPNRIFLSNTEVE